MLQIGNSKLASSFSRLKCCGKNHNCTMRSVTRKLLEIPRNRIDKYGNQSLKYNCIVDWNKFKDFPDVNQDELSHFELRTLLKDHIISQY